MFGLYNVVIASNRSFLFFLFCYCSDGQTSPALEALNMSWFWCWIIFIHVSLCLGTQQLGMKLKQVFASMLFCCFWNNSGTLLFSRSTSYRDQISQGWRTTCWYRNISTQCYIWCTFESILNSHNWFLISFFSLLREIFKLTHSTWPSYYLNVYRRKRRSWLQLLKNR